MTKKTAVLILMIVSVLAGVFVIYMIFFAKNEDLVVKVEENPTRRNISAFPEGGLPITQNDGNVQNNPAEGNQNVSQTSRLRQITNNSVSGFTLSEKSEDITSPDPDDPNMVIRSKDIEVFYRYIERSSGNILEASSKNSVIKRLTNTTIPKIQEAIFFADGEGVILRYLNQDEEIETYVAKKVEKEEATITILEDESDLDDLKGVFLVKDIDSIIKSPSSDLFFYTKEGKGYTFDAATPQNQKMILDNPITEWLTSWSAKGITLTTKPSYRAEGFSFNLSPNGGQLNNLLTDMRSLNVNPSPNGTKIFFSYSLGSSILNGIYDVNKKEEITSSTFTLAEKCVWSKKYENIIYCAQPREILQNQPDLWYQGVTSFNDDLYVIDAETGDSLRLAEFPISLDVINPKLSESETHFVFINKRDLTPWSLDIRAEQN